MAERREELTDEALFGALLFSLHAAGMQQLGKVINPLTGKVERDLQQAQATIEMMEMLKRKTDGNLTSDESKLLGRLRYELQMNYVDESRKDKESGTSSTEPGTNQQRSTSNGT